jgi:hypothetical protein
VLAVDPVLAVARSWQLRTQRHERRSGAGRTTTPGGGADSRGAGAASCGVAPPVDWADAAGASTRAAARGAASAAAHPSLTAYPLVSARRVAALPRLRPIRSCRVRAYGVS